MPGLVLLTFPVSSGCSSSPFCVCKGLPLRTLPPAAIP